MDIFKMSKTKKIEDELKKIKIHFLKYFYFVTIIGHIPIFYDFLGLSSLSSFLYIYYFEN